MTPFDHLIFSGFDFSTARSSVEIDGGKTMLDWRETVPGTWQATAGGNRFSLECRRAGRKTILTARGELERPAADLRLTLFSVALAPAHLLTHGARMGRCRLLKFPLADPVDFESFHLAALTAADGGQLVLTMPLTMDHIGCFRGQARGANATLSADFDASGFGGTVYEFAPVTLEAGDAVEIMREYGRDNSEVRPDFSTPPECGWNSWDYYRWTITEDEVLANAEFIARDPVLSRHIKRIIVDDGWQYCYGEWEPNHLFPSGMQALAARLTAMGFEPGLWIAPAIVEPHARIAQWNPEMLAQSRGGQPCLGFECMRRHGFLLDPTVPGSRRFLRDLFDRYSGYGFKYFKLDFLFALLQAGRYADAAVPRGRIPAELMKPIVEGVAGRAEILGCNYAFMTGNRFVRSVRIGSDIHARWSGICANAASIAARFWSNKVLWLNDPDFALCRGVDTSSDPDLDRLQALYVFVEPSDSFRPECEYPLATATRNEIEVLLSLTLMAGGAVNFSDKMYRLNELGLDMARKVAAAESGAAALPLDLFDGELPTLWLQKLSRGGRLLAVNWSDSPAAVSTRRAGVLPDRTADFWHGGSGPVPPEVELAPHSCRLFVW